MLLQTPRRGLLSAKLSSFTGPEEEEESEEEPDEKQQNLHTTKRDILYQTCEGSSTPHPHTTGRLLPWQETC